MTESGPGMPPTEAVVEHGGSLRPQIVVIAGAAALLTVLVAIDALRDPASMERDDTTALNCAATAIAALAHAMWISLDCRRRGAEVGWWRFAAILLGPLAIWVYLVAAYRAKALLWIPVSVLVYIGVWGVPAVTWLVLSRIA